MYSSKYDSNIPSQKNMGLNFDMGLVRTLLALTKSQSKFDTRNSIRLPSPMGSRYNRENDKTNPNY